MAISIRQHKRHIQTDLLVTQSDILIMKVQIEGNPGTGNSYTENTWNIEKVETLAPNVTTIINKHYHIGETSGSRFLVSSEEAIEAVAEQMEQGKVQPANLKYKTKKKPVVDTEVIKDEILLWVSRVRPLLDDVWKADFQNIWADILDMQEVKDKVYAPGKQKNTNFNQYLVGNILYFMFEDCGAWSEDKDYNASEVCMRLINTTEHQLRKELAKFPPEDIRNRLTAYFTKRFQF